MFDWEPEEPADPELQFVFATDCPMCGESVSAGERICAHCGESVSQPIGRVGSPRSRYSTSLQINVIFQSLIWGVYLLCMTFIMLIWLAFGGSSGFLVVMAIPLGIIVGLLCRAHWVIWMSALFNGLWVLLVLWVITLDFQIDDFKNPLFVIFLGLIATETYLSIRAIRLVQLIEASRTGLQSR